MTFRVTQKRVYNDAVLVTLEQECGTRHEAIALARRLGATVEHPYDMGPGVKAVSVSRIDDDCDVVTRIVEL